MDGDSTSCCIGAPISANRMYVRTPNGVFKSRRYKAWIEENLPNVKRSMRAARRFPVEVSITVVQGRDWGPHCDIDNAAKAIVDLLTRAQVLPDDSGRYVSRVHITYMPLSARGAAVTRIEYVEPEEEPPATELTLFCRSAVA